MCDKAADAFQPTLKFVPNWFVSNKILQNHYDNLFSVDNIIFFGEDSNNVTFFCDEMGIFNADLNNINLDYINFDKDDPGNCYWSQTCGLAKLIQATLRV